MCESGADTSEGSIKQKHLIQLDQVFGLGGKGFEPSLDGFYNTTTAFAARPVLGDVCGLDYLFTLSAITDVGSGRLVSTPSHTCVACLCLARD